MIPDHAFDEKGTRDRSVILYGNADTNGVWDTLLAESPVQVRQGAVIVEDVPEKIKGHPKVQEAYLGGAHL